MRPLRRQNSFMHTNPTRLLRSGSGGRCRPAGDLDLFLWGRGPREALATDGDLALVDKLRAIAADSTGWVPLKLPGDQPAASLSSGHNRCSQR